MFKVHVVQAQFGDSLILEFGTAKKSRYVLIDGGPPGNYAADLEPALSEIVGPHGKLDLVLLSHIDNDHIIGVLDLFAGIEEDDVSQRKRRVQVAGLWHNSFERTIDPAGEITQRMQALVMMAGAANLAMPQAMDAFLGLREGHRLRLLTQKLKITVNKEFKNGPIMIGTAKQVIKLGPLEFRIAGPSKANLNALQDEWLEWLDKVEEKISSDPAAAAAMADKSIPNLSSIVVLAKCNGKTLLLTGDARGDHILGGLKETGLARGGKIHVDVLKVQHHGSDRNASREFFNAVTAETYVISANGKYGNPDLDTLIWIVESARDQQRQIRLVLTNETDSTKELQKRFKPSTFNYTVAALDSGRHSLEVPLSS